VNPDDTHATPAAGPLSNDIAYLKGWIGRVERVPGQVTRSQAAALAATLDRARAPVAGEALPPLWHWLLVQPPTRQSELARDGGPPSQSGFLPPVALPRRMWAAGRLQFNPEHAILVGEEIVRESEITNIEYKEGRSGGMVFVTLKHTIRRSGDAVALVEEQDIVYRGHAAAGSGSVPLAQAPADFLWAREIKPEPALLFRYSALTFNGHRIHYDRAYATGHEGYPGLVVHGPLTATLLAELLHVELPTASIGSFSFRASAPLFDDQTFLVCGQLEGAGTVSLWAQTAQRRLAMSATANLL
jgi:3-methylfumaryl-CoA hydratase